MSANEMQHGGDHYKMGGQCQHWDFVEANGLGYLEGCASKYVSRWRRKNGVEDLQKADHYIMKLIETGRPNRRAVDEEPIPVSVFAAANGLDWREQEVVEILAHWQTVGSLEHARRILQEMMQDG